MLTAYADHEPLALELPPIKSASLPGVRYGDFVSASLFTVGHSTMTTPYELARSSVRVTVMGRGLLSSTFLGRFRLRM